MMHGYISRTNCGWGLLLLGLLAMGCEPLVLSENECDAAYWCEGDLLMECFHPGGHSNSSYGEVLRDCKADFGTTCSETYTEEGDLMAGCVIADDSCDKPNSYVCAGNKMVFCDEHGVSIKSDSRDSYSGDGDYCVESQVYGGAVYAYDSDLCETDGEQKCLEDGSGILTCRGDVWDQYDECSDCVEWRDQDGVQKAGCRLSSEPCPESEKYMCLGSQIASCEETGFPIKTGECGHEQKCVLSALDSGEFICAYSDEPCKTGQKTVCAGDDANMAIATCEDTGYPTFKNYCGDFGFCVMKNGEALCAYGEGPCEEGDQKCNIDEDQTLTCIDGIWQEGEDCSNLTMCVELQGNRAECR